MPLAYHMIFTAYGFWLPNDPRGSYSDFVGSWELFRFGPATKVSTRRSVAGRAHDRGLRLAAKRELKYPEVHFDGAQCNEIVNAFAVCGHKYGAELYACAILPEHIHLVITLGRFGSISTAANQLKKAASNCLRDAGIHPFREYWDGGELPTMWARRFWKVYLDEPSDVRRAIGYVEQNPVKEGKKRQRWTFLKGFSG